MDLREKLRAAAVAFADDLFEIVRAHLLEEVAAHGATHPVEERRRAPGRPRPAPIRDGAAIDPRKPGGRRRHEDLPQTPEVPNDTLEAGEPRGRGRPSEQDTLTANVVEFLRRNPGARSKAIRDATGAARTTLHRMMAAAIESGLIRAEGGGYFLATPSGGGERQRPPAPRGKRTVPVPAVPRAPRGTPGHEDLAARVTAFVRTHAGCRYSQIAADLSRTESVVRTAIKESRARGEIRMEGTKRSARYYPVEAVRGDEEPSIGDVAPDETSTSDAAPSSVSAAAFAATDGDDHQAGRLDADDDSASDEAAPTEGGATAADPEAVDAEAESLFSELDDLVPVAPEMHDIRLGHVLQALVAELRAVLLRFPAGHRLAHRIDLALGRIYDLRTDRAVGFIVGLKRDATGDWDAIGRKARKKLAKYDRDGAAPVESHGTPTTGGRRRVVTPSTPRERHDLPRLSAIAGEKPIALVGGIKRNEVIENVRESFGIDIEWVAMQSANARTADDFVRRIRGGGLGAVVVLEGLTGTTQVKSIVDACKDADVPFAYGGRAGTESLRQALVELERAGEVG
jgi:hypothetical protein